MTTIINWLDKLTDTLGKWLSLASFAIMTLTFLVVVMRYGFKASGLELGSWRLSSIALQESVLYLHGILFMLASAYTLKHNGHVRVDVLYRRFSPRAKAWVDLLGTLVFLFPMSGFILFSSLDYVGFSWQIRESSDEAEGLPYVYLAKSLIPLMAGLLLVQGLAEILRSLAILSGRLAPAPQEDVEAL
ncbi:MAG: TRAP transporter small permease subunit [Pseudomonadota bacterium]|nr:TRAP transporter small permease subunit [Pseudomonadota bacterium]